MASSAGDPGTAGAKLLELLREQRRGILITLKRDGRPQASNVAFTYHPATRVIKVSITEGRAKTRNLRRDPRASFHLTTPDLGAYLVAEGAAELSPVAAEPGDATVEELIEVYRAIVGEHPDWAEYRAAMVDDRRLVLRVRIDRVYGWSPATGTVSGPMPVQ